MSIESLAGEKVARVARMGLLAAIAVMVGMIAANWNSQGHPFTVRSANAEGAVTAAPGYLVLSMNTGGAAKFYVADTTKQVVCVYEVNGDKLRLVGARKFDYDADVFDGSLPAGKANRGIEGGNGITRAEAKDYAEATTKMFEEYKSKKGK